MSRRWILQPQSEEGNLLPGIPLQGDNCTVGSASDNDVVLSDSSVSSHHAKLLWDEEDQIWYVQDLESTNGTWLGDQQLTSIQPLQTEGVIEFGILKCQLLLEDLTEEAIEKEEEPIDADSPPPAMPVAGVATFKPEDEPQELPDSSPQIEVSQKTGWSLPELPEQFFRGCTVVHTQLARWLPRIIGRGIRLFTALPLPLRFTIGFLILSGICLFNSQISLPVYPERLMLDEKATAYLEEAGVISRIQRTIWMGQITAVVLLLTAFASWVRHKPVLWVFKTGTALFLLYWGYVFSLYTAVPSLLNDWDYKTFSNTFRNEMWILSWSLWIPALFPASLCALGISLRSIHNVYLKEEKQEPLQGDRISENLQTGGRDPRMRSSTYWALFLFTFSLAAPFLMKGCGFEDPYGLVQGSGEPVVEMVKVKRKKKPQKKMIVNNWSPYIFERMKIDDIQVLEEMEESTQDTYEVTQTTSGKLGKGGGDKGGWPEGMEGATVRFIRLKYSGGDWNQDMGKGSDYNLLLRFNDLTGFPIAQETEAKTPSRLRMFPKGKKPPFVYITGKGGMRFSSNEIKTLRWYTIEEGGMLFIDHGGGRFHSAVQSTLGQIFPGQRLVDIPNDDPIYQAPFLFPSGAPPLWQHAGKRAMGIRHDGRWVVFYHPGDMGDAWKDGHSGASGAVAEQAYRLGINVMYYAFNMYYARHYE